MIEGNLYRCELNQPVEVPLIGGQRILVYPACPFVTRDQEAAKEHVRQNPAHRIVICWDADN